MRGKYKDIKKLRGVLRSYQTNPLLLTELELKVFHLRCDGAEFRQIGMIVGRSDGTCIRILARALKKVEALRHLQILKGVAKEC